MYRGVKNTVDAYCTNQLSIFYSLSCQSAVHPSTLLWMSKEKKQKNKNKTSFLPPAAKSLPFFPTELARSLAIINLARRRYFYWSSGKILKEDTVMLFGNNSWMTGKEMDFPSGWQFAAHGARACARSKSGCCQEWLSRECEPTGSKRRKDSALLFCLRASPTQSLALRLWASDAETTFKTCRQKKKKSFERSLCLP